MKLALLENPSCAGSRLFLAAKPRTERKERESNEHLSGQDSLQGTHSLRCTSDLASSLLESVQQFSTLDRKPHDIRTRSLAPKIDTPAARLRPPQIPLRSDRRCDRRARCAAAGDGICHR